MYKSAFVLCLVFCVVIEARPKWQFLPPLPGYVPVYIQTGDTPLDQINPELAEAFHALPAGRSANKHLEAEPESEISEQPEQPEPEALPEVVDPYEKRVLEKKNKKVIPELPQPIERR